MSVGHAVRVRCRRPVIATRCGVTGWRGTLRGDRYRVRLSFATIVAAFAAVKYCELPLLDAIL